MLGFYVAHYHTSVYSVLVYVQGSEEKAALLSWGELFLDDMVDEYEFKKQVRPLLDYMKKLERSSKK